VNPARQPRSRRVALGLALVAAFAMARPQPAFAEPTEHEVKAALIFNLTRFVQWPAGTFISPTAPLVLAILGQDEVTDALAPMLLRKHVDGHPIEARRVRTADEARGCQMLFVAGSEKRSADAILKTLRGASLLTVADIEDFAARGGHINLVVQDQRVQVFVNPASAREARLTISAKLQSLATIVGSAR
jgi:hypothetical protein